MIENLIYEAIIADLSLTKNLALYEDKPAIFYQQSPDDMNEKWTTAKMFPRITYNVDWSANPERKSSGSMTVEILCLNETAVYPEDISENVLACLSNLFMTDDSGTYAVCWKTTDNFDIGGGVYGEKMKMEPKIIGVVIAFDILAFPSQITFSPDPIEGLNNFIKKCLPYSMIIGYDEIPRLWRPTDNQPAVYCRLSNETSIGRQSFSVTWLNPTINVHVFAPSASMKQKYLQYVYRLLSLDQEVILDDNSPMFIKKLNFNMSSEPLYDGQMTIIAEYGVLNIDPELDKPPLIHGNFSGYRDFTVDFKKEEN